MRKSFVSYALLALVSFSATGCATSSNWMPRWTWWRSEAALSKETALAETTPALPSQVAAVPNGLSAPTVSYPGTPATAYGQPQYSAQPASAYVPTGQAGYTNTQAGPYNPAAYGQTAPAQPYSAQPYSAQPANVPPAATSSPYPSTTPGQSGGATYPTTNPASAAGYPATTGPQASAATSGLGSRYAAGSPYDSSQAASGTPYNANAGYTLQPSQPVNAATQAAIATTPYQAPITTADARNAYPGSATPAASPAQPNGFRPGGTSNYTPIQPASAGASSETPSSVVPAGGAMDADSTNHVHPASATVPNQRYNVYQAGGASTAAEPHRFTR